MTKRPLIQFYEARRIGIDNRRNRLCILNESGSFKLTLKGVSSGSFVTFVGTEFKFSSVLRLVHDVLILLTTENQPHLPTGVYDLGGALANN